MTIRIKSPFLAVLCVLLLFGSGCAAETAVRGTSVSAPIPSGPPAPAAPAYAGKKATITIAALEGTHLIPSGWGGAAVEPDMEQMLVSALMTTGRFRVVSRSQLASVIREQDLATAGRIRPETAVKKGEITGADLLVKPKITGFDPGYSSASAAVGAIGNFFGGTWWGTALGLAGKIRWSSLVLDIQVIDNRTSETVLSTTVEGNSTDLGGGAGVLSGVSVGVSAWKGTQMEKVLRAALEKAVGEFSRLPPEYFKH